MGFVRRWIERKAVKRMADVLAKAIYGLLDRIPLKSNRTVIAAAVSLVSVVLGLATKQIEPSVGVPLISTALGTIWAALHEKK